MSECDNRKKAKDIFERWPEWKKNFSITKYSAQRREKPLAGSERGQWHRGGKK